MSSSSKANRQEDDEKPKANTAKKAKPAERTLENKGGIGAAKKVGAADGGSKKVTKGATKEKLPAEGTRKSARVAKRKNEEGANGGENKKSKK